MNCDAYHMTDPRSDGLRVSSCISKSLEDAGVAPEEVSISVLNMSLQMTF
jgi:3-oxoacyl-[acyl-carrier-protein] synthase II